MRRWLALLALGPLAVVLSSDAAAGPANEFQILTGFSAKEACSCVFVVQQSDTYCVAFGQQPGYPVKLTVDHTGQIVTSAYSTATRVARFAAGAGCTLDPLP
jgi:hypothetical protein